jgi:hypothetical protein
MLSSLTWKAISNQPPGRITLANLCGDLSPGFCRTTHVPVVPWTIGVGPG